MLKPALSDLINAGFKRMGCWRGSLATNRQGIELDFVCHRDAGVYAFVVDETVHYVGSAQRGLHNRLSRYATTRTLRTSSRIRTEILGCLKEGRVVEVYTLVPPKYEWRGLPIDLIAGVEEGLIRRMRPVWNRRSNRDELFASPDPA